MASENVLPENATTYTAVLAVMTLVYLLYLDVAQVHPLLGQRRRVLLTRRTHLRPRGGTRDGRR